MDYSKVLSKMLLLTTILLFSSCSQQTEKTDGMIKAFCLDFNWDGPGTWSFAKAGDWADVSPEAQIQWYKDLGVNTIQTFCVSSNGYAWYKNDVVPVQPGLTTDYLREMVKLGHKENMRVMGYFCIGSNTRWGEQNPAFSYGSSPVLNPKYPTNCHIPYTQTYLSYLDSAVRDAVKNTGIDGFMIDWIWQPTRESTDGKWIECEKQLYEELMNKPFPGEELLTETEDIEYSRLAIDNCWNVIYKAAKESNPDCIIWLSSNNPRHPYVQHSTMFKEIDWLMNEAGDLESLETIENMIGSQTKLITCLAEWNKVDPKVLVPDAMKNNISLYGYARPNKNGLLSPIDSLLALPIDSFKGDLKNIATLARAYNGLDLN